MKRLRLAVRKAKESSTFYKITRAEDDEQKRARTSRVEDGESWKEEVAQDVEEPGYSLLMAQCIKLSRKQHCRHYPSIHLYFYN